LARLESAACQSARAQPDSAAFRPARRWHVLC